MPLFRSFEDLQRDEQRALQDFGKEWTGAFATFDLAGIVVEKMKAALASAPTAKNDTSEIGVAHSEEVDRLRKAYDIEAARHNALAALVEKLKAAVERRNERLYGMTAVAKRSMRFASAQQRRYHGPAATVITIGKK